LRIATVDTHISCAVVKIENPARFRKLCGVDNNLPIFLLAMLFKPARFLKPCGFATIAGLSTTRLMLIPDYQIKQPDFIEKNPAVFICQ